jgi:hypothetical protein
MQKTTKDLFLKLKALRPSVNSIEYYYGIDWKADKLIERWYLQRDNKHYTFNTEKDLCDEMKRLISSTESDLGFRFPETTKKLKLE